MNATEDDVYFVELVPGPTERAQPESTVTMRSFYLEASTSTPAGQALRDSPIQFFVGNHAPAAQVGDPDHSVLLHANPGLNPFKVRICVQFTLWLQGESQEGPPRRTLTAVVYKHPEALEPRP
jgi:hypothetical protein